MTLTETPVCKFGERAKNFNLLSTEKKKISLILKHIRQIHEFYGNKMGTQLSRKHIFWYSIHLDQKKGTAFWPSINRVSDHSEQYFKFQDFLYSL